MSNIDELTWSNYQANQFEHQVLKSFILLEIQHSEALLQYFWEGIHAAQEQQDYSFSGVGNGYEFEVTRHGFLIESLYDAAQVGSVLITYQDVLSALQQWRKIISNPS